MTQDRTILTKIFSGMQNLGNKIWRDSTLNYCVEENTFHMFNKKICYNCMNQNSLKPLMQKIEILEHPETFNPNKLKNHFGSNLFYPKLIEIINNWPEKNRFLFNYVTLIKSPEERKEFIEIFLERKKLYGLYYRWENLTIEEKFNEIFDFEKILKNTKISAY